MRDEIREIVAKSNQLLADEQLCGLFAGRVFTKLNELGLRFSLLFDEFELTSLNPNLQSFYDALRSLPTRTANISYVIATRTGLAALQSDYSELSSPFFNIFTTLTLRPFNEHEVHELIFDYFSRAGIDFSLAGRLVAHADFLFEMTGYHPFFLQLLCYHLCDRLDYPAWPGDQAEQESLRAFEKDALPHFEFYWRVSSETERERLQRVASQQQVGASELLPLIDRCLVVADPTPEGEWRPFSSAFGDWCLRQRLETISSQSNVIQAEAKKSLLFRPVKILFLAANPTDTRRLRLDEECRAIDQALYKAEFRDRFDMRQHWAVRVGNIQELLLRHKPDIVHFSGHGSRSSEIILEDDGGNSYSVPADALSDLFSIFKDNIRCVVLNACYSEQQAQAIAEHIDCVVGMSRAIGEQSAISFATAFYRALGYGRDIETAFKLGRMQINLEKLGEQNTPKLLAVKSDPAEIVFVRES